MKKTIPKEKISEFLCRPAESRIINFSLNSLIYERAWCPGIIQKAKIGVSGSRCASFNYPENRVVPVQSWLFIFYFSKKLY